MKIYQIHTPKFTHNGVLYNVKQQIFQSFSDFQNYLNKENPEYVYIYSITNNTEMHDYSYMSNGNDVLPICVHFSIIFI